MLAKHTDRVFADLHGPEPGVPDGMKVDVEGKVYCGGAGGLSVMDKDRQEARQDCPRLLCNYLQTQPQADEFRSLHLEARAGFD